MSFADTQAAGEGEPAGPAAAGHGEALLLAEAARVLAESRDGAAVLAAILDLAQRLFAADAYAVWRRRPGSGWAVIADLNLPPPYPRCIPWHTEAMPAGPLCFEDVEAEPLLGERLGAYRAEGFRSLLCIPLSLRGEHSGTLTFYYRQPHRFDPAEVRLATALGNLAAAAITATELYEEQQRLRVEAVTAQERLAFLAEASAALASSLDYTATLEHVARLVVPRLADWCTVHLVEEDGTVRQVAVAHADPARVRWAWALQERYPYDPSEPRGIPNVLRTGQTELYPAIPDEMLVAAARDAEHLAILRQVGFSSCMVVPLSARDRVLGAISFIGAESGFHYGAADVALAEDLARRAAAAIDNARLYRESQRALAALRASEERFRATYEQAAIGIKQVALDGRLLEVNARLCDMLGYTREELLGLTFDRINHPEDLVEERRYLGRLLAGEIRSYTIEKRYLRKDGAPVWVRITSSLAGEPGAPGAYRISAVEDIGERKQAEADRERLLGEVIEASQQQDVFLAMLGHELRSPLSALRGTLALIERRGAGNPALQPLRERAERQVLRMAHLIDDLQDVTRISRGKIRLECRPIDLARLVRDTVEDQRGTFEAAGLTLTLALPEQPVPVKGDPVRLAQVLVNLLNNAAKFTDPGGQVRVGVGCSVFGGGETLPSRTRTRKDENENENEADRRPKTEHPTPTPCATITVWDTGVGIEPELLPRLFETFVQAERSLDRSRGGLGIGLALAKGLVELHGGEISAASEGSGRGAEFRICLPLAQES